MQATSDLLGGVNNADMSMVQTLRHEFGERSLPAIVSTVCILRQLDDNAVSSLACLDASLVNSVSQQRSFAGVDDFAALFLRITQTLHVSSGQTPAKRRRYDDDGDFNDFASSSSAMYVPQNQSWNLAADHHTHLQH